MSFDASEDEAVSARRKARQREVWRLIRNAIPVDYSVSIESGRAGGLGEARLSLTFSCVFEIGEHATDAHVLAMADIARDRLIEGIKAWPKDPP